MASETITIRIAKPEDEVTVTAVLSASYRELDNGIYDRQQLAAALPAMSHANPKLLASGTYYIAEVEGAMAACGGWTVEQPGTGESVDGIGHIRHFATHPDFLRRGIARMLLDRCIEEARTQGVWLLKSQSTLPAEKFYAKAGFRRIRMFDVKLRPGITLPGIDMERELT